MFGVMYNGRPAEYGYHPSVHPSWNNSVFRTIKEANEYAEKWCGMYWRGYPLNVGEQYDYSGCEDFISIEKAESYAVNADGTFSHI